MYVARSLFITWATIVFGSSSTLTSSILSALMSSNVNRATEDRLYTGLYKVETNSVVSPSTLNGIVPSLSTVTLETNFTKSSGFLIVILNTTFRSNRCYTLVPTFHIDKIVVKGSVG
ncbi:hypothetical protein BC01_207 [Bacillus phage BC01]|nr:hypothetical protein BC01_207 [Bacillus phage BC01]